MNPFAGLMAPMVDRPCIDRSERPKSARKARKPRLSLYDNPFGLPPSQACLMPLIVEGLTAKEIALAHRLSLKTVEAHIAGIRKKMGVRSALRAAVLWDRWSREHQETNQ